MNLSKLAEALGLPKDSPQDKVLTSAAAACAEGVSAKESLSKLTAELEKHGLKLDGEKVIKLAGKPEEDLSVKDTDDPEKAELKRRLAKVELDGVKGRLASAKKLAADFVKSGKVPPAIEEKLARLLSISDHAESLALSADGSQVVKATFDALGTLREILDAIPSIQGDRLSQLAGDKDKDKSQKLAKMGAEIARRNQPLSRKKKEPAGAA